jgi:hypothetical protein
MADLTAKARQKLPSRDFALPVRSAVARKFPGIGGKGKSK